MAFAVRAMQLSGRQDPRTMDILAAAYAEKGDFDYAERAARAALAAAALAKQSVLAEQIEGRVELYVAHRPFRDHDTLGQE